MLFLFLLENVNSKYTCPPPGIPQFSCPGLPEPLPATNVRKLKPGNIAAVMALGDSITAGALMKDAPLEYRGDVYANGGDADAISLVKNLMTYNPKITGWANGTTIPYDPLGAGLNTAVSGAVVEDVPSQIKRLHELLEVKYREVKNSWKLLTLFIGANNACGCYHSGNQPAPYEANLRNVLTYIKGNFSKTFVSLVTLFNISAVWDDAQGSLYCKKAVPTFHECSCLDANKTHRTDMDLLTLKYNQIAFKVAAEFEALKDPEFTVVVQPGLDQNAFGSWGEDFLSDLDCFHPSLCTNQGFALALWNNLFTPPEKKSHSIDPKNPPAFYCPTANDYLQ